MTLQERQQKEIEALSREALETESPDDWVSKMQALNQVIEDPETYFKNIDKEE